MGYSKKMCLYVVEKEQNDLIRICEDYSDNVRNPYDNIFFLQNAVLDTIIKNLKSFKKCVVNPTNIYKGLKDNDMCIIKSLNLEEKFDYQQGLCENLDIEYYNHDQFMEILEDNLTTIANKYNLNAGDDYNKLYNYIFALKLTLASSDDALKTLVNQHEFLLEHSPYYGKKADESITLYGKKIYKIDILRQLLGEYVEKTNETKQEEMTAVR